MDFQHSARAQQYIKKIKKFINEKIRPVEMQYFHEIHQRNNGQDWSKWSVSPLVKELKEQAKAEGLWNLFLPDTEHGQGLSTIEYAPLAEEMGKSFLAPEIFNCNAPDTGNMEVLHKYGTTEQKEKWLTPLLNGEIRSAFCMTEPDVASSDATNMQATAIVQGDEIVINGTKWWSSGIGHPDCKVIIFMGLSDASANRHSQHSMVLVPVDTEGVTIERMLPVFGEYDEPYGHGEVSFKNVRVPLTNMILGKGRGFALHWCC